jgi:DNA-binding response OmpR family regulator
MVTITTGAKLNIPMSELRPAIADRILVIEHDNALRKILDRLFSAEGFGVDIVPSGPDGLEMLRQGRPAAVVFDLPFPASSGSDLCREIASLMPGLPLVILATSVYAADRALLLDMGADDYVTIPFSPNDLMKRLRVLMRHASCFPSENLYVSEAGRS